MHWADHKDLSDIKIKFQEHERELSKFRPSRKIENKVVCVKCIFHGLGMCIPCEGEVGVKIQRKYLIHAAPEKVLVAYPDFETVLLDYDGKLEISDKKAKLEKKNREEAENRKFLEKKEKREKKEKKRKREKGDEGEDDEKKKKKKKKKKDKK